MSKKKMISVVIIVVIVIAGVALFGHVFQSTFVVKDKKSIKQVTQGKKLVSLDDQDIKSQIRQIRFIDDEILRKKCEMVDEVDEMRSLHSPPLLKSQ